MKDTVIQELLEDLKSSDEGVRDRATRELWRLWFWQKGLYGLEMLERSQNLLQEGDAAGAEAILTDLIQEQPDFAEAWNRRAVLHFTQQNYEQAIADCEEVLRLNPVHFGALHGLGLCHAALHNYREAIRVFRRALEIQPYAIANQKMLLECTVRLNS